MTKPSNVLCGILGAMLLCFSGPCFFVPQARWLAWTLAAPGVALLAFPAVRTGRLRHRLEKRGVEVLARLSPAESWLTIEGIRPWTLTATVAGRTLRVRTWLFDGDSEAARRSGGLSLRIDPEHPDDFLIQRSAGSESPPSTSGQRWFAAVFILGVIGAVALVACIYR